MTVAPNLAGFAAAQRRLRDELGVDADFTIPVAATWDPAEAIDPDTGRPYDPFATPTSGGGVSVERVRCSFASRPIAAGDPQQSPIGDADPGQPALIIDAADYARVRNATRVTVGATVYDVQLFRQDLVARYERWLCFLEHA